ncbi:MAG: S-layer homology domain-containing protein, partial [Planctomycetota bacterium]
FGDVPETYWAYPFVETIAAHGITTGCGTGNFCPDNNVSRSQMAVFLERGIHGADFTPPPASGALFSDVSASDFAAAFIEQLYADGITAGCGNGNYCPDAIVTRDQMAIFLLRAKHGPTYTPPPAVGIFSDVGPGAFAAAWIEQLAAEGISAGCGTGDFCPDEPVTRAQMSVFVVRTFELASATADTDGDGTPDLQDAFPNDPTEWVDTDGDGIGNNADTDDDNDGDPDILEQQCGTDPLDPLSRADINGDGQCDAMPAHLSWRVRLPGAYSLVRPAVGPDGSVYAVDVSGYLVAVSSTGSVLWSAENAGRSGVDVGPDGTVYTGSETWIKAFNPDGTLKWTFTQSPAAQIFHDVAVGPDGHVYALASSGLGVFSLEDTASGPVLRWTNPEPYVRAYVDYTELAFGPTVDGVNQQLYFNVNGHVRAIRLSDGSEVFSVSGLNQQQRPKVSPLDGTWHFGDAAYSAADGSNVWTYDFGTAATGIEPALGQSGIHYTISGGDWLFAVNPGGTGRYSTPLEESVGKPDVNLAETMLLLPTSRTFTHPSAIKAVSTSNGSPVWRLEFPPDGSGNDQHVNSSVAFSADGGAAYVMTNTSSGAVPKTTYLNAINTDPAIPSSSTLLRSANEIAVTTKLKGQSVTIDAVVTVLDENRNPVPGVAVQATWTLPDNSTVTEVVTTNNSGDAKFSYTGAFGWYSLNVTDMVKSGYAFDPRHSYLNIVRFAP